MIDICEALWSMRSFIRSAVVLTLLISYGPLWAAPIGPASEEPDLRAVIGAHGQALADVQNDPQALALFSSRLGPSLGLQEVATYVASKKPSQEKTSARLATQLSEEAIRFTKDLAAWRLAMMILQAADSDGDALGQATEKAGAQAAWLAETPSCEALGETWRLAQTLVALPAVQTGETASAEAYARYAAAVDQAYPRFVGGETSWLSFAMKEGADGVTRRLGEIDPDASQTDRAAFQARYMRERLRPVFLAHLMALSIRAEAQTEQRIQQEWGRLRNLRDTVREQRGLAKLCGKWQWTVHNHQNHAEHKLIMSFPGPDEPSVSGPKPARTLVVGDVVYLRWEFDRGITQEDSLLFGGEGQRLEGTFVSSAGPWGSITAKRVAPCGPGSSPASPPPASETANTPPPNRSNRR